MKLEEKLACLRKGKGLSQMELAETMEVSRQAISKWEMGDAIPTTENLKRLSQMYGVSLDVLLDNGCSLEERTEEQRKGPAAEHPEEECPVERGGKPLHKKGWAVAITAAALLAGIGIGILVGIIAYEAGKSRPHEWQMEDLQQEKVEFDGSFFFADRPQ